MKIYEKPSMTVELLLAEEKLANDVANLGEVDPIEGGEEISVTAPDSWLDY